MLKTYLYLKDDSLIKQLWALAQKDDVSRAEILRQAIAKGLEVIRKQRSSSANVLLKIAELGEKNRVRGPRDVSTNLDKYLWGI